MKTPASPKQPVPFRDLLAGATQGPWKWLPGEGNPTNSQEANILRSTAHEIIIKLHEAKETRSLELLKLHCARALEEIALNSPPPPSP